MFVGHVLAVSPTGTNLINRKMKTVLYRTARGEVDLYRINPDTKVSFDNERDGEKNVGFRARTVNRDNEFRSFRYDRMIRQGLPSLPPLPQ